MRMSKLWVLAPLLVLGLSGQAADFQRSAIPGWRLALQAWTFNGKTVVEVIDKAKELGIQYIECFPGQKVSKDDATGFGPGMSEAASKIVRDKLAETGCHVIAFGVTGIPGDEKGIRSMFGWAQTWGIGTINTEIGKDMFPLVDRLAEEYGLKIGLHNHPKPSHYWDPAFTASELAGCSFLGACADTGHWPRSGVVALDGLKKLEGHIASLHFKDLDDKNQDAPWGTGKADAKGMLAELQRQGFRGTFSIEYEKWDAEQEASVRKCAEWWFKTVAELAGK
ncbi:MAG: sugar phosphate isomerase/epimerase [Armatimonadetes bacterium]|nr:sugar phosphate isomerase/epimerase [Armatimonadota bacterium]